MDDSIIIREFEKLAHRMDIAIRHTAGGPDGLCTIKGGHVLFIDKTLDKRSKIEVFVREFRTLDFEGFFVVPVIRRLLGLEDEEADW
ncbi:hypothetical protein ACFL1R_01700 [Candidatus Latescibacterota bacterium]